MSVQQPPLLDAIADMYIHLTPRDISCAVPQDHCRCAVAQAIKRVVGRSDAEAAIYPSVAYILMPANQATIRANGETGKVKQNQMAWHRFRLTPEMGAEILAFDQTGVCRDGAYVFKAPSPSMKLKARRARAKKPVQNPRGNITVRLPWRRDSYYRIPTQRGNAA